MSPFKPKPRQPDVEQAIAEAVEAHEALRAMDRVNRALSAARARAVAKALGRGATMRELGKRLGLSAEQIRRLAAEAEEE